MTANPPLTLAQAAALVGMKGKPRNRARRLKRVILAKEAKINREIMLRTGGDDEGMRYTVTRWSLQRFMPELFDRRDELVERLESEIATLREKISEHDTIIAHLGKLLGMKRRRASDPRVPERDNGFPVG